MLDEPFTPPADLDPFRALEEQMSQGWPHPVEVEIDAPLEEVRRWLPRSLGRTEAIDDERTRLTGSTENLNWYATEIAEIQATFTRRRRPRDPRRRAPAGASGIAGLAGARSAGATAVSSLPSGSPSSTTPSRSPSRVAPSGDQPLRLGRNVRRR